MLRSIFIGAALMLALTSPVTADEPVPAPATPAATVTASASSSVEVPQAVKDACQGDYEKLCSEHEPESDAVRECMARAFDKLSDGCVTAILDSPLADQAAEVASYDNSTAPQAPAAQAQAEQKRRSQAYLPPHAKRSAHSHHGQRKRLASTARKVRAKRQTARFAYAKSGRPQPHVRGTRRVANAVKAHRAPARTASNRGRGSKRGIAGYIRRGTGIARYYVGRYVRFASW